MFSAVELQHIAKIDENDVDAYRDDQRAIMTFPPHFVNMGPNPKKRSTRSESLPSVAERAAKRIRSESLSNLLHIYCYATIPTDWVLKQLAALQQALCLSDVPTLAWSARTLFYPPSLSDSLPVPRPLLTAERLPMLPFRCQKLSNAVSTPRKCFAAPMACHIPSTCSLSVC